MHQVLLDGLAFSATGISIVFVALALIAGAVALMRRLDEAWDARSARTPPQEAPPPTVDDTTLVLIAAAVATVVAGRHRITRVRRLPEGRAKGGGWSQQGRAVLHGSHVVPVKH